MSTIFQIFSVPSSSTFDQPNTMAGRQWKIALGYPARCPGFSCAWWGRHFEAPERVTLLLDWNRKSAAQAFLSEYYNLFAALLQPLVTTPPTYSSAAEIDTIHVAEPASLPGGGGLTSLKKLTFDSLNADQRYYLLAPTLRGYLDELDASIEACEAGFKGSNAGWEVDSTGARTATLWMLTSWTSVEAEQWCEKELRTANDLNMKDAFLKKVLEKTDTGEETHHVAWEMLTPNELEWWKDSDNTIWPYKPLKPKADDLAD